MRRRETSRNICITCSSEVDDPIIVHKTRRQTHSMCERCFLIHTRMQIDTLLKTMSTNQLFKKELIFSCPGSFCSESRNVCQHTFSLRSWLQKFRPSITDSPDYTNMLRIFYVLDNPGMCYLCTDYSCTGVAHIQDAFRTCKCEKCSTSWCANCGGDSHPGMSCLESRRKAGKTMCESESMALKMFEDGTLKFCPRCSHGTIKDGGCNKMQCVKCSTKWCWLCGEADIDYDHYNSAKEGSCSNRLWENTENTTA